LADQEKRPEDPKGDFTEAHKEVNYIFCGPDSYEPKRKQKVTAQEVMAVSLVTPEYLSRSEVPITFHRGDYPDFLPKPGWYPLVVYPHRKAHQARPSVGGWRQLPQPPFSEAFRPDGVV
jgi:hypothetical protein